MDLAAGFRLENTLDEAGLDSVQIVLRNIRSVNCHWLKLKSIKINLRTLEG